MRLFLSMLLAGICVSSSMAFQAPVDLVQVRDQAIVRASLQNTIGSSGADETIKAWVFFTDKGLSSIAEYNAKLETAANSLTERARIRRMKALGENNIVSFWDIPVYQPYIDRIQATGVKPRNTLRWFNAVTVEGNTAQLEQIASLPFVLKFKRVSVSTYSDDLTPQPLQTANTSDNPVINSTLNYGFSETQLEQINTVVAHELGFAGQDVLVCMMDTGYRQGHVAFQAAINEGRLIAQHDFVYGDDNTDYDPAQETEDQPRHGTLTWSTLGGLSSGFLYGPAYLADFCLSKTEDISGEHHSEEDNWAAGAEWADSLGAAVISASLGYRYDFTPPDQSYDYEDINGDSTIVSQAADWAAQVGITVCTAQGNDGYFGDGSLLAPADCDSVIAVGAVGDNDEITGFSAWGPTYDGRMKPEVCAMGLATACADPFNFNGYTTASGTSLSTPLIGGVSAVLLSAHPNWTPMMVREALMMTATNTAAPDNQYGWGIADIGKALFYHPQGDIVIEHQPLVYFPSGLDNNVLVAQVYGGAGIAPYGVSFFMRTDDSQPFSEVQMDHSDENNYSGIVPGLDDGYLQYYFRAVDIDGASAVYPYGAPDHFFTVYIDSTEFFDSFENGLYYWKTEGANGGWALTAERANTGNISITDSPYRDYNNSAELTLTSNFSIYLFNADSASVSFYTRHILQTNYDMVYFEVSTDGGQTWELPGPVITGTNLNFTQTTVNLANFLEHSVMFRFRMTTNETGPRDGIHIDDFRVVWDLVTGIADNENSLPVKFALNQNYPNPFNPSTTIKFSLPENGRAELTVYDILGQRVKSLVADYLEAGAHEIIWDGTDQSGDDVASGMYLYKLQAGDYREIKRMTLLR